MRMKQTPKANTRSNTAVAPTEVGKRKKGQCDKCKMGILKKNLNRHLKICSGTTEVKSVRDSITGRWTSKHGNEAGQYDYIPYDHSTHKVFGTIVSSNDAFYMGGSFSSMLDLLNEMDKIVKKEHTVFEKVDYWTKQSNDGIVRATSTGTRRRNISLRTIVKNTALTQVYCHGEEVIEDKTEWNRILELFPFPSLYKKERMLQKLGIFYSKGNVAVDEHEDRTSGLLLHVFGQGVTQVLFHGTNPDNSQSWKVSELTQPGDCILIPGQVKHTVRSRGERACFSFYHY